MLPPADESYGECAGRSLLEPQASASKNAAYAAVAAAALWIGGVDDADCGNSGPMRQHR